MNLSNKGFTLVEIVIVLAVIAVIASPLTSKNVSPYKIEDCETPCKIACAAAKMSYNSCTNPSIPPETQITPGTIAKATCSCIPD